jgi:hypothetical protein
MYSTLIFSKASPPMSKPIARYTFTTGKEKVSR